MNRHKKHRTYRRRNALFSYVAAVEHKEMKLFWLFVGGIIAAFVLQVYLIISTSVVAANENSTQHSVVAMRSQVGQLESSYLNATRGISLSFAEQQGYSEAGDVTYAKTTALSLAPSAVQQNQL